MILRYPPIDITDSKENEGVVKAKFFEFLLRLLSGLKTILAEKGGCGHDYR